jgi:hypothetical protein
MDSNFRFRDALIANSVAVVAPPDFAGKWRLLE